MLVVRQKYNMACNGVFRLENGVGIVDEQNEIVRQLHLIIDARLFGAAGWPVDRETANRLQMTLLQMRLVEEVPGEADTWRNTPLGNELHLVLLEVFMGFWDEWEVPEILEDYGLIEKWEVHRLRRVLSAGAGWEQTLKDSVRRAYLAFYNPTHSLS
jgi:hypothetical protein